MTGPPASEESDDPVGLPGILREWRQTGPVYLLIPLVLTGLLVAAGSVGWERLPEHLLVNALVTASVGLFIAPAYLLLLPVVRALGLPPTPLIRWALRLLSVALGLLAGTELAVRGFAWIEPVQDLAAIRGEILRVGVVVASVVTAILAMRAAAERRQAQMAREVERARLAALQARTEPHFLYNTLNTVAALIPTDPAGAEEAVLRLSDLLRYVLDRREQVTLREELAAVDDYLAIEALRLGERLQVVREIDPALLELLVPPLVLQPLVENAVQHGIAGTRAGGTVWLRVVREGRLMRLSVEDDGPGEQAPPSRGTGRALDELRRRIGGLGELTAGPRPEGGYRATVVVRT